MAASAGCCVLLAAVVLFTAVAYSAADCSLAKEDRLGCFSWWKWDTPERCGERGCCTADDFTGKWCFFPKPKANITTVHVIQGCHIDVGFAQTSQDIVNLWFNKHLPLAVTVGRELAARNASAQLRFTAPAWIVSLYLQCPPELPLDCPNSTMRELVLEGIAAGYITWYAFPFNVEMEFMDPAMIRYGVEMVHQLDDLTQQRHKTVLSQRDVPGLTRAALPILRAAGVRAISVGVNGGSTPPNVPKVFQWIDAATNTSMRTMYLQGGYGGISLIKGVFDYTTAPGLSHAMIVDWRGDNAGPPPTPEAVEADFKAIQKEFPGATVRASTFEEWVDVLETVSDADLPAITDEIGDSWIHGVASDPLKNFSRLFLKNGEHTWGLDCKSTLTPRSVLRSNWSNVEFNALVTTSPEYVRLSQSWWEQRQWGLDAAMFALADHPLASAIKTAFAALNAYTPVLDGFTRIAPADAKPLRCGALLITFNTSDGSIASLVNTTSGVSLLGVGGVLGALEYQTYSQEQYTEFMLGYNYLGPLFETDDYDDFDKVGIGKYGAKQRSRAPALVAIWVHNDTAKAQTTIWVNTQFDDEVHTLAGAPAANWLGVVVPWTGNRLQLTLQLFNKTATRLPEALFFRFAPQRAACVWSMSKLGGQVDPTKVVTGGGKWMHVVDDVSYSCGGRPALQIITADSGLVRWGQQLSGLPVPTTEGPRAGDGGAFVLTDNLWGTNYIMWYPFTPQERSIKYEYTVVLGA